MESILYLFLLPFGVQRDLDDVIVISFNVVDVMPPGIPRTANVREFPCPLFIEQGLDPEERDPKEKQPTGAAPVNLSESLKGRNQ